MISSARRRAHEVVLAAHDDRLLGAGVHAEAAVDAAQQVDLEAGRVLLDRLLRPLARLDVDALGRADGRAHVAGDALGRAVLALGQDVDAAVAARDRALLLGELDRRGLAQEHAADHVHEGDLQPPEDRQHAGLLVAVDRHDLAGHQALASARARRRRPRVRAPCLARRSRGSRDPRSRESPSPRARTPRAASRRGAACRAARARRRRAPAAAVRRRERARPRSAAARGARGS